MVVVVKTVGGDWRAFGILWPSKKIKKKENNTCLLASDMVIASPWLTYNIIYSEIIKVGRINV